MQTGHVERMVWNVIPKWEKDEPGVSAKEICDKTELRADIVLDVLGSSSFAVEEITCGDNPVRYRRCKQN